jgi:hypothetical protein
MAEAAPERQPEELGPEEFRRIVADRIRRRFGMTIDEFVAALRVGELPDTPEVTDLAILVGAGSR